MLSVAFLVQLGIIKGQVIDVLNNEFIFFVNVFLLGIDIGIIMDVDGNYEIIGLELKLYDVCVFYLGYINKVEYEV